MKKIFLLIICIIFAFCGCTANNSIPKQENNQAPATQEYIKAVWLCYFELSNFTMNKSENEFKDSMNKAIKELKDIGFNTITVQVRPCADAFYKSSYFPSSKYCFGTQDSDMPYDPLKIICEIANEQGIKVEAWINPYRVSQSNNIDELSDNNIAKIWHNDNKKSSNVYIDSKAIYFNPASQEVNELIINGVVEIVKNYNIYSIHFDDYFYPTKDETIDKLEYEKYINNGGKLSLDDWRRENVNAMVKGVYKAIKSTNNKVLFGISPSANIENDYNNLYADVKLWSSQDGYVDYMCPQVYYGFKNETQPFMEVVKRWMSFTNKKLYIGLPLYKCGKQDKYASKSDTAIQNEFIENNNIISRQITYLSKIDTINGFYIFSYSSLFDEDKKAEVSEIIKIMQSNNQA